MNAGFDHDAGFDGGAFEINMGDDGEHAFQAEEVQQPCCAFRQMCVTAFAMLAFSRSSPRRSLSLHSFRQFFRD